MTDLADKGREFRYRDERVEDEDVVDQTSEHVEPSSKDAVGNAQVNLACGKRSKLLGQFCEGLPANADIIYDQEVLVTDRAGVDHCSRDLVGGRVSGFVGPNHVHLPPGSDSLHLLQSPCVRGHHDCVLRDQSYLQIGAVQFFRQEL